MNDLFDRFLKQFIPQPAEKVPVRQNELVCIDLQKNGWKVKDTQYIPGSYDIIVYWYKENNQKSVRLNPAEQSRWVKIAKNEQLL